MSRHYFEFVSGNSAKFWECAHQGNQVGVRFGRIGTVGCEQTKDFSDAEAASRHAEKLMREKTAKGYRETIAP